MSPPLRRVTGGRLRVGLTCLVLEAIFDGATMPGEYDDNEVGVDVRLLKGPGESEYRVEGLLVEVTIGPGVGKSCVEIPDDNPRSSFGIGKWGCSSRT